MKLVDTHCHIYGEKYREDLDEVLERAEEKLEFMVNIGYDMESSKISVEMANKYPFVYATVGFHPTDIDGYNEEAEKELLKLAENPKVLAIGEIGLDYHWTLSLAIFVTVVLDFVPSLPGFFTSLFPVFLGRLFCIFLPSRLAFLISSSY